MANNVSSAFVIGPQDFAAYKITDALPAKFFELVAVWFEIACNHMQPVNHTLIRVVFGLELKPYKLVHEYVTGDQHKHVIVVVRGLLWRAEQFADSNMGSAHGFYPGVLPSIRHHHEQGEQADHGERSDKKPL
ncbi:MAG: hypothetical protein AAF986_03560 [Pseudomonadota bacterium]